MKTSIVLATYNGSRHIREQIQSILNQTDRPDELIVADDGSTDDTLSIIKAMTQNADFTTRTFKREFTLGYARNFSSAALTARNDVILFCDQDDYWGKEKISIVKSWFKNNPNKSLVIHNISVCNADLDIIIENYYSHLDKKKARHTFVKGCATAARRTLIERAYPLPTTPAWTHDVRLHAIACIRGEVGYIDKPLIQHRIHSSQTSGHFVSTGLSLGGKVLNQLDNHAWHALPEPARMLELIPGTPSNASVAEFLQACGRPELLGCLIDAKKDTDRRREILYSKNTKCKKAIGILHFLSAGGYRRIGGVARATADFIRTIN